MNIMNDEFFSINTLVSCFYQGFVHYIHVGLIKGLRSSLRKYLLSTIKDIVQHVEARLKKKLLNFDACIVLADMYIVCSWINKQPGIKSFEIDAVTIKKSD